MSDAAAAGQFMAKGSTVRSTLAFLRERLGDAGTRALLGRLPPSIRQVVDATASIDEVPYEVVVALWHAADAMLPKTTPSWADAAGAFAIDSIGVQLYGGILRKPTPKQFLTQSVSLFRLYYHPGDMEVVEDVPGRAVLRLVRFDPVTPVFCQRQSGGLRRAIELAGGGTVLVRHVRCCLEGDAFCEWELHWQMDPSKGTAGE